MTMIVGHSVPSAGSFVASDIRTTLRKHVAGQRPFLDLPGKVVFTGSGWVTGGGSGKPNRRALRALREGGAVQPSDDPIARAARIVLNALSCEDLEEDFHVTLIEPGIEVIQVTGAGAVTGYYGSAWPTSFSEDERSERFQALLRELDAVGESLAGRIQVAAKHLLQTHRDSKLVSEIMEVGYLTPENHAGLLRGSAQEIAAATPGEVFSRFRALPSREFLDRQLVDDDFALAAMDSVASGLVNRATSFAELPAGAQAKVLRVSGVAFTPATGTEPTGWIKSVDFLQGAGSTTGYFFAFPPLPQGVTITAVRMLSKADAVGGAVSVQLWRQAAASVGSGVAVTSFISRGYSASDPGGMDSATGLSESTTNRTYALYLEMIGAQKLYAVSIEYTMPSYDKSL